MVSTGWAMYRSHAPGLRRSVMSRKNWNFSHVSGPAPWSQAALGAGEGERVVEAGPQVGAPRRQPEHREQHAGVGRAGLAPVDPAPARRPQRPPPLERPHGQADDEDDAHRSGGGGHGAGQAGQHRPVVVQEEERAEQGGHEEGVGVHHAVEEEGVREEQEGEKCGPGRRRREPGPQPGGEEHGHAEAGQEGDGDTGQVRVVDEHPERPHDQRVGGEERHRGLLAGDVGVARRRRSGGTSPSPTGPTRPASRDR